MGGMNPAALRLLMLLQNGQDPYSDDEGLTPPRRGLLPSPESMGRRGIDVRSPEQLPPMAPQPLRESEEDRIRRLFTEETPGMRDYRSHVASAPVYEDYKPSKGRTILSALLAGASSFLGEDAKTSTNLGMGVLNAKYNRAVNDYKTKGKGLEDIATLDERRKGKEIQAETAIEGMKTRKAIADQTFGQRVSDEQKKHSEELERAKDRDDVNREKERHNRVMEKLLGERENDRRDAAKDRAENRIGSFYDPEKNENVTTSAGEAKARGLQGKVGDKIVDREKFIRNAKTELEDALKYFSKNPGKTGQIQGRFSKVARSLDMGDPELLRHMNALESYRGESLREKAGTALTKTELKVFDPVISGVTQSDTQLITNLKEAVRRLGEMSRGTSSGSGGKKTMKLSDGTEIEVEE